MKEKLQKFGKREKSITIAILAAILLVALGAALIFPNPMGPDIRFITAAIRNVVVLSALLILALMVYRAIKNKNIKIIGTFFLMLLLIIVLLVNLVIPGFHILLNQLFVRNKITDDMIPQQTATAREITTQIEAEGAVLLKNEQNALPLKSSQINLFGYASQALVYGGAGSGSSDESKNLTLPKALEGEGFSLNTELADFYTAHKVEKKAGSVLEMLGGGYDIHELQASEYSTSLINNAKNFSNTALVVISRNGGEGADMPLDMTDYTGGTPGQHYLQLTKNEIDMLNMVESNFEKVVVLINSSSPMNLGFLDNQGIDAALWIGGPGSVGLKAVAQILQGSVNPSGRLPDTYAYDVTSSPAFYNTGSFSYLGSEHEKSGLTALFSSDKTEPYHFNNYQEGIYVGYRYYETAAADGYIDYDKTVQYPFGYGLSYTSFEQTMGDLQASNGTISVDITVKNTGKTAGKEVVQLYHTPPYTKGGIEKSHVVLTAFDKTRLLQPGESETIPLSFPVDEMSSYDAKTLKSYVLEPGDYEIKLMNNSHNLLDSRTYTVDSQIVGRTSDKTPAENHFDDAAGDVEYISRANWEGTMPKEKTKDKPITPELMAQLSDTAVPVDPNMENIVFKNNHLTLADMKGLPYDDPQWELLLQQLSVKDMEYLVGSGGWQTVRVPSVGKPQVSDIDGPAGLNGLINGTTGNQYPSEVVVAATWNTKLAEDFGKALGDEAYAKGVSGVYAPAMNIHRTPFSGRNFEYYSEDGLLSGKLGAAMVRGLNQTNTYSYIKHFALDDQETNVIGLSVWSNEQAIREIYLRPFEITVKEGETKAVMSSWNRIGTTWTGNSDALLKDVLRDEWGFIGVVITDNSMMGKFMNPDQAIDSGNDMMLSSTKSEFLTAGTPQGNQNLRNASHNILFVVANSNALDLVQVGIPTWIWVLIGANIILMGLILLGAIKCTGKKKPKKNKKEEQQNSIEVVSE